MEERTVGITTDKTSVIAVADDVKQLSLVGNGNAGVPR